MKYGKIQAPCSAYQGKVVVSGGRGESGHLSVVEAYDHIVDEWVEMLCMINARYNHSQVSMKNKLFVIGGGSKSCEVYHCNCQKFELISKPMKSYQSNCIKTYKVLSVGKNIFVYDSYSKTYSYYDVEKD